MAVIFNERFEATGYDETSAGVGGNWSPTNAGGGTLDPNYAVTDAQTATGLSLPYWGNQCLKLAGGTTAVFIEQTLDSLYTDLYLRFDFIIGNIADLGNGNAEPLAYFYTNAWADAFIFWVYKDGSGNLKICGDIPNGGSQYLPASPFYAAAINTKYRIDCHFVGGGTCELKINGVSQGTATAGGADIQNFDLKKPGNAFTNAVIYFDNVQLATGGWVPDDATEIVGTVCWGHSTGVTEDNTRTFATNWTGTGAASGVGDAEILTLDDGEYGISEVVNTGSHTIQLLQNAYAAGDSGTLKYRTGATSAECQAAGWTAYTEPFESDGYVQVYVEN